MQSKFLKKGIAKKVLLKKEITEKDSHKKELTILKKFF